jgi:hypothetical protein
MPHFSKANEFDTITFKGKDYRVKFYQGFVFATNDLEEVVYDYDSGEAFDDDASKIDDKIACYFDESDFNFKDGKELYKMFENGENYRGL